MEEIGATCYYLILLDDICEDNIEDCLNEDKQLKYTDAQMQAHSKIAQCNLTYTDNNVDVARIVLDGDVVFNFNEDNFAFKGAFLVTNAGYVMGYSINPYSVNVTNQMIFEDGLKFYEIVEGAING